MKPDIVVRTKDRDAIFILDTKWKVLSESKHNYGIAQSDMYQMYAYQKKYNAVNVRLLYPMTNYFLPSEPVSYTSEDGVIVQAEFIDLYNVDQSIRRLTDAIRVYSPVSAEVT